MATKDVTDIMVLKAYSIPREEGKFPYDHLMESTGECFKVCYRAMERAERNGLLECGVSLRTGWITVKGLEFLKSKEY